MEFLFWTLTKAFIFCALRLGSQKNQEEVKGPLSRRLLRRVYPLAEEIAIERGYFGDRMRCLAAGVENSLGGWFSPKISQAVLTLAFSRGQTIFQTRLLLGIHRAILLQGI